MCIYIPKLKNNFAPNIFPQIYNIVNPQLHYKFFSKQAYKSEHVNPIK